MLHIQHDLRVRRRGRQGPRRTRCTLAPWHVEYYVSDRNGSLSAQIKVCMPACGRHQHCHSKSMAVYPIVSRAAGGSPLSFTVAGIADAPPGEIFSFLINPQEQVGVVSSIQARRAGSGAGGV